MTSSRLAQSAPYPLSERVLSAQPSATKAMTALARHMRQSGQDIITLSQGEPDFETPVHVREAAKRAIDCNQSGYTDVPGTLALREAIARKFQRDNGLAFEPAQIQVGCGAKQVIYNALQASLDAGDEVIIPAPRWVSYPEMVRLSQGTPVLVKCDARQGFKLTAAQLADAITPRTKWLMLNSPSNPTGAVYSHQELASLAQVLVANPHVWVMSDDIYELIRYDNSAFATMVAVEPLLASRALTINGLSKAFAMTGWRVGYGAGPTELIRAMNLIQSQSTSHTSSISQAAAIAALDGPMAFLDLFIDAFRRRRDMVYEKINAIDGLSCELPQGAFYVFADCTSLLGCIAPDGTRIATDVDLSTFLLQHAHVAVVPGSAFALDGYLRLSYAISDESLEVALTRMTHACASLRS